MQTKHLCVLIHICTKCEVSAPWNRFMFVYVFFCLVFVMPLCASVYLGLVATCWERLNSWLSFVVSNCEFVTFALVSWVRCGTWLYRFLIFAPLITLSHPVKYFIDRSKAVLLLWIICVIYVLCLSCFRVFSLLPCRHLKGKGWPLGSCLLCLLWFCYFPIMYPGADVVLDCIDSWSLLSFLLQIPKMVFRSGYLNTISWKFGLSSENGIF